MYPSFIPLKKQRSKKYFALGTKNLNFQPSIRAATYEKSLFNKTRTKPNFKPSPILSLNAKKINRHEASTSIITGEVVTIFRSCFFSEVSIIRNASLTPAFRLGQATILIVSFLTKNKRIHNET